jgi:CDP-glycerol glycerophosphotransferase (TagB/SpsB family)
VDKIRKIIHYCWFGGSPLPELAEKCIESWRKYCPDYEIMKWDESNFDINGNRYVSEAYEAEKWAFVADYVRLYALYHHGGIYMDTDVELIKNIDDFLKHSAFSGFEDDTYVSTAIMGSEKNHGWIEYLLSYYNGRNFVKEDGSFDLTTNVETISAMTREKYKLILNNTYQELETGIAIYPKDYFCPKSFENGKINITKNTCCIHYFNASWWSDEERKEYQKQLKYKKLLGEPLYRYNLLLKESLNKNGFALTFDKINKTIFAKILKRIPLKNIILFESLNDLDCNSGAVFDYMIQHNYNNKYKMIWLVQDAAKFSGVRLKNVGFLKIYDFTFKYIYYTHAAKYIIWDNEPVAKNRNNQISIYLTHGWPTVKNVKGTVNVGDYCDFALCTSEFFFGLESDQISVDKNKLFLAGHPRNDYLFSEGNEIAKITRKHYKSVILWMPTFRKWRFSERNDSNINYPFGIPLINSLECFGNLNDYLAEKDCFLIIKIHSGQKPEHLNINTMANVDLLTSEDLFDKSINLYSLIGESDALISDYSSVAFDYLLTDNQLGYVIDDIDDYKLGFAFDNVLDYMPGEKIQTFGDLFHFIDKVSKGEDEFAYERKRVRDLTNKYQDNQNCKRIVEYFGF